MELDVVYKTSSPLSTISPAFFHLGAINIWHESFARDLGINIILDINYKRGDSMPVFLHDWNGFFEGVELQEGGWIPAYNIIP